MRFLVRDRFQWISGLSLQHPDKRRENGCGRHASRMSRIAYANAHRGKVKNASLVPLTLRMGEEDIRRNSYPVADQAPLPSFHKRERFGWSLQPLLLIPSFFPNLVDDRQPCSRLCRGSNRLPCSPTQPAISRFDDLPIMGHVAGAVNHRSTRPS